MSSISSSSSYRGLPSPDSPDFNRAVKEIIEQLLGQRGNELDRAATLRDLQSPAIVNYLNSQEVSVTQSGVYDPVTDTTVPPPPTNLELITDSDAARLNAFNLLLTWTIADSDIVSYYEVWVSESASRSAAVLTGVVTHPQNSYAYFNSDTTKSYWFWIRSISYGGIASTWEPTSPVNGYVVTGDVSAKETIDRVLNTLKGESPATYAAETTYSIGERCSYTCADGKTRTYRAIAETTGNAPASGDPPSTNNTHWERTGILLTGEVDGDNVVGIDGNMVVDGTIVTRNLDAECITSDKIAAAAITTDKIGVGAVSWDTQISGIPDNFFQTFYDDDVPYIDVVEGDYWINSTDNQMYRCSDDTLEDETGSTWGPFYHGLSLADGQAFLRAEGFGVSRAALYFDGNDDVTINKQAVTGNTYTVELWVKAAWSSLNGSEGRLFSMQHTGGSNYNMRQWLTSGAITWIWPTGSTTATLDYSAAFTDNVWTHIAASWEYSSGTGYTTLKIFKNGVQLDTTSFEGQVPPPNTAIYLGAYAGTFFKGYLDEVRVWNVARSEDDIQADMNRTLTGKETGLVGYWKFDETGSTAIDSSSGGNNGTITGATRHYEGLAALADGTRQIRLQDSAGKTAVGHLSEPGGGETLGSELAPTSTCTDPSDDQNAVTGWDQSRGLRTSESDGDGGYCLRVTENGDANPYVTNALTDLHLNPGKLYKISFKLRKGTATNAMVYIWFYGPDITLPIGADYTLTESWVEYTKYFTVPTGGTSSPTLVLLVTADISSGLYAEFNDVTVKEVTDCASDGVSIASTLGGSTQNWASVEAGFNYNSTTYTFDVSPAWEPIQDAGIQQALEDAADAQSTADGKIVTFVQAGAPTASATGDLWLDSDDGYRMYRWDGDSWNDVHDTAIDDALENAAQAISDAAGAQGTADGKVTTFFQDSEPTAEGTGDLWIDTNDSNKLYRWSGAEWVTVRDTGIAEALSDAALAQSTADGKIVSYYQPTAPIAEATGDLWFDTDDNNKPYRCEDVTMDDESGVTFGMEYNRFCFADGSAFFQAYGIDLGGYVGRQLTLVDYAGKRAIGWIEQPAGCGPELVTNGRFDSNIDGWVGYEGYDYETVEWVDGAMHCVNSSGSGYCSGNTFQVTAGKRYLVSFDLALTSGTLPDWSLATGTAGGLAIYSYRTCVSGHNTYEVDANTTSSNGRFFFYNTTASNFTIDNISVREMTNQNLLLNGSFETGTEPTEVVVNGTMEADSDWVNYGTPTTNERSAEQAHGGTYSRKVVTDGSEPEGIVQDTGVGNTGYYYKISGWVYISAGAGPVQVYWDTVKLGETSVSGSWQYFEYYRVKSTATGSLYFFTSAGLSVTFYVDDVSITRMVFDFDTWGEYTGADCEIARDNSTAKWGTYSCKLTRGTSNYAEINQTFTTVPGAAYRLTFWARGDGTRQGRYLLYDVTNAQNYTTYYANTGVTAATWTQVTEDFVARSVSTRLYLTSPSSTGSAWFDDVSIVVRETLGSELVTNGDGEAGAMVFDESGYVRVAATQSSVQKKHGTYSTKFTATGESGIPYFWNRDSNFSVVTAGKVYKVSFWYYLPSGQTVSYLNLYMGSTTYISPGGNSLSVKDTWTQVIRYVTAQTGLWFEITMPGGSETTDCFYLDDVSIKEVSDVSVGGVQIVSECGGSTRNWNAIETSFVYNRPVGYSEFTFDVFPLWTPIDNPVADWSKIYGEGKPSDNATSDLSLILVGDCALVGGNGVIKSSGTSAWDSSVYSRDGYTGGAFCSSMAGATDHYLMSGLNTDPTSYSGYESIDYAWFFSGSGVCYIYESGVSIDSYGVYTTTTVLSIAYDGSNIRYMKDGVVVRTVAVSPNLVFFFNSSFYDVGSELKNIRFSPLSSRNTVTESVAASPPSGAVAGDIWYQTDTKLLLRYTGAVWSTVGNSFDTCDDLGEGDTFGKMPKNWKHSADATYIDGGHIYTGTVVAGAISTTSLSAISANLGTITAGLAKSADGKIQVDFDNKWIKVWDGSNVLRVHLGYIP